MRVVGLHHDVLVCTSAYWQTTCTIVRGALGDGSGAEAFVIDSPIVRGALTAILWIQPLPYEHRIVGTRADANAWLRGQLTRH